MQQGVQKAGSEKEKGRMGWVAIMQQHMCVLSHWAILTEKEVSQVTCSNIFANSENSIFLRLGLDME